MKQLHILSGGAAKGLVGCAQVTEILYTNGVQLVDVLAKAFELATVYTAAAGCCCVDQTAHQPRGGRAAAFWRV